MPLYVYQCTTCGHLCEELQRVGADPPDQASDCPRREQALSAERASDADAEKDAGDLAPCDLVKQVTSASHRFTADFSSDGIGGYKRQGDAMVRVVQGRNTTKYGEGSV